MEVITLYEAFDGTRFDDEYDCFAYEREKTWNRLDSMDGVKLYGDDGNIVPFSDFDTACAIDFTTQEAVNAIASAIDDEIIDSDLFESLGKIQAPCKCVWDAQNSEWTTWERYCSYIKPFLKLGWEIA